MEENKEELLTKDAVWDVLAFSQSLASSFGNQYFTPELAYQNLLNLNNSSEVPTLEKIQKALIDTKNSRDLLKNYSQYLEENDMTYRRLIEYYTNMLSFDLSYVPKKDLSPKELKCKEFKEDKARVDKFLSNFDHRDEFRKVVKQILRNELYYTCYRDDTIGKTTLQILPQNRCKITGYWERGLLFDFDFSYFLQPSATLEAYAPSFTEYFKDVMDGRDWKYNPINQLGDRNDSFAFYHQLDPSKDKSWAWKFDMSNFTTVPFLAPMMKDSVINEQIKMLQKDKNFMTAHAVIMGEMALLDGQKSGEVNNAFAVDPVTLGKLLGMIRDTLNKNIKMYASPVKEVEWYQYEDKNPDMYDKQLNTTVSTGTSASRLIFSTDKMSQSEMENAITNDGNLMKKLYSQFENFLDFYINKKTRNFKFTFKLDGINYEFDRNNRIDRLMKFASVGVVLDETQWASAYGMNPQEFSSSLSMAKNGGFIDKLSMLLSIHTATGEQSKGRPIKKSGELKESGETSRDYS